MLPLRFAYGVELADFAALRIGLFPTLEEFQT